MTDVLLAKRFMQLFRGYSAAYGTYDPRKLGGSGKQKPFYSTKKQTYSSQEFLAHLNGSSPIGIYPLDDQELVSFAAIDIDEYPIDHENISKSLKDWNLPLVVCNSKSGGVHAYVFFQKPELPGLTISCLSKVSNALGYADAEIFPKQKFRQAGKFGSFINLPFFRHTKLNYACWDGNTKLDLDGFLKLAEKQKTTLEKLSKAVELAKLPLTDIDAQTHKKNEASGRNDFIFKYSCELSEYIDDEKILLDSMQKKNLTATKDDHENFLTHGPLPSHEVKTICNSVLNYRREDKAGELSRVIDEFNQQHAHVMIGGKARILNIKKDPIHGWDIYDFSTPADFKSQYANKSIMVGDKLQNTARLWLQHVKRRSFKGLCFNPGKHQIDYFNLFQGFPVQPIPGDCHQYLEHINLNICKGDEELYNYILDWMADAIQNPNKRPGVALAIRGKQGVGKGIFVNVFASLFGPHTMHVTQSSHLVGNFNAHLKDKLLVFADEAFWAGDKRAEGALKGMVTEDTIAIEMKGVDVQSSPNFIRLILASNNDWLVPASADQRRFVVIEAGEARMQDSGYFAAIMEQIENGGREALMHLLCQRDLTDVNLRKIPKTDALRTQQTLSLDSVGKWLHSCLYTGEIEESPNGDRTNWPPSISPSNFHQAYLYFCKQHSLSHPFAFNVFGKKLKELLPAISKIRKGGKTREIKYLLPTLEDARSQFEKVNGWVGMQWEDSDGLLL